MLQCEANEGRVVDSRWIGGLTVTRDGRMSRSSPGRSHSSVPGGLAVTTPLADSLTNGGYQ